MSILYEELRGQNLGLAGKLLISTPYMEGGTCFSKSVIYILVHDENGTLGVIVNRVITSVNTEVILKSLNLESIPKNFKAPIHFGGPVEPEKGLILHSNDYRGTPLLELENGLYLSSNLEILMDLANGKGPKSSLFAIGYAGWEAGQLENEIKHNAWITLPYSKSLVFKSNNEAKWSIAINSIGIIPSHFASNYGTA